MAKRDDVNVILCAKVPVAFKPADSLSRDFFLAWTKDFTKACILAE